MSNSTIIEVKLLVAGRPSTEFALESGATVANLRDILAGTTGFEDVSSKKFQRGGTPLTDDSVLEDTDRLTIYTKVEGGTK